MKKAFLISICVINFSSFVSCTVDESEYKSQTDATDLSIIPPVPPPHGDDDQDKDKTKH